ncbi:hypothetical protein [Phytopseudomonas flavescens]|uniref:hypothetical protein n=1 Tax=Phytopseudomonas flavescens TaxID=29435 RepID=UPI001113C470|nr:hypothetical protein [Pseudomonas flavescens]
MQPSIEQPRPLRVLTEVFANQLCAFNAASRALRRAGVVILSQDSEHNCIVISHEMANRIADCLTLQGFAQSPSAGSTLYRAVSDGVTVQWREPISSRKRYDWELH